MSMLGMSGLNEIVRAETYVDGNIQPNLILNKLRQYIIKSLRQTSKSGEATDGMDIALCVLDFENKQIQYAGANNPIYLVRAGELKSIDADKMPIGIHRKGSQPFTNNKFNIEENDTIYIFSDGYIDQFGGKDKSKFLSKNFKELLVKINHLPMDLQKDVLDKTFGMERRKSSN